MLIINMQPEIQQNELRTSFTSCNCLKGKQSKLILLIHTRFPASIHVNTPVGEVFSTAQSPCSQWFIRRPLTSHISPSMADCVLWEGLGLRSCLTPTLISVIEHVGLSVCFDKLLRFKSALTDYKS